MRRLLVLLSILLLAIPLAFAEEALTNAEVIKMTKAGLGTELIVAKVQQAPTVNFKLDTDDLIQLKDAGVAQPVIEAMLERQTPSKPAAAPAGESGGFPPVALVSSSGSTALAALEGDHKQFMAPFVGLKHFVVFDGKAATVHIKDRQPVVELSQAKDPAAHWYTIIERIKFMIEKGYVRRLAPIINTQAMGREATLAAVKVPEDRIDEVSAIINEYSGVSHNYLRKGKNKHIPYNMWFTMSAKDDEELRSRLKEIEDRTGLTVRSLPTTKKFKIGVRFKIY